MTHWRGVVGYEDYYKISDDGQVWSVRANRLLKTPANKYRGYEEFAIRVGKEHHFTVQVHRELAKAFIGLPPFAGAQVRHLNGIKTDNRLKNLEWGTAQENQDDRCSPYYQGAKRLTSEQELEIKRLSSKGMRTQAIADKFGYHYNVINKVLEKKQTDVTKELLWRAVQTGATVTVIAEAFGVTHGAIVQLLKKHFKSMREIRQEVKLNKSRNVAYVRQFVGLEN